MRRRALFTQVIALNAALVCVAALLAAILVGLEISDTAEVALLVGTAASLSLLVNMALLRARFAPLEHLIEEMEKVDLSRPGSNLPPTIDGRGETEEVERIELAFIRMMRRLEAERRRAGSAALRAQEEERARVARDLHDEVNQSLTGVLLRLEAAREAAPPELEAELSETRALANQAMEELLSLARQLRPTALDDLGLKAAIAGQVDQIAGGDVRASLSAEGDFSDLSGDVQLVVYRVAQEALTNATRHSGASQIEVSLRRNGSTRRAGGLRRRRRVRLLRGGGRARPSGDARAGAPGWRRGGDRVRPRPWHHRAAERLGRLREILAGALAER